MKPFTLAWWLDNCINAHVYMEHAIRINNEEKAKRYAQIAIYCENKILEKYGETNEH